MKRTPIGKVFLAYAFGVLTGYGLMTLVGHPPSLWTSTFMAGSVLGAGIMVVIDRCLG